MHWLHNVACSSNSNSSAPSSSADDNYINNRTNTRIPDVVSLFSPRRTVGPHHRRLTNHQHLKDNDVVQPPSHPVSTPHILPLPELSAVFKRESAANQTSKYILPSPEYASRKSVEKRVISDSNYHDLKTPPGIIASLDRSRNTEHKEPQFLQKWPQASLKDEHKHGETVSAPAAPISSQAFFPSTSKIDTFSGNQLYSAPELPSPGVPYHYQSIHDRNIHNYDGSSVNSPDKRTSAKIPLLSSSPLHKNSFTESPMSRYDSNAHATVAIVHPLPVPPQTSYKFDSVTKTSRKSQWQKGKLIGRGTFGSVYVGSNRETGALCAMKEVEILPDDPKSAESIKQLQQEIDVLSQLKHPNIVQYYGSEIVEDRFYIYLEYVHPGSINKYAREHCGGVTESIVRNFTRHIVSGLAYLHSTKTIHRDIKGANLLVDANGVVKLADFGMAKHLDGQVNLSLKGSPYWMAPELLQSGPQKDSSPDLALAVDIWSLGCTIIEMMNGKPPWSEFEGPAAMFRVMKETPPIPETMSADGKDFLRCCFIRNPAERPTANMLLEHKFLMVPNRKEHSR